MDNVGLAVEWGHRAAAETDGRDLQLPKPATLQAVPPERYRGMKAADFRSMPGIAGGSSTGEGDVTRSAHGV